MIRYILFQVILVVLVVVFIPVVQAQDSLWQREVTGDHIRVISRAHKDSIVLRWAPSAPAAWKLLNTYGYKVERYTVGRDGRVLQDKPMVILVNGLKPAAQSEWEHWIEKDDMIAVAAQAIFGEEFQVDAGSGDVMEIYNKVRELESRYSFGLFAADISARAARLSALGLVDKDVKNNEMYLYRVYSLVPASLAPINYGFTYTGPSQTFDLPAPRTPEIEKASETSVLIRWETLALRDIYTSYFLERSLDGGKNFEKINTVPMTILLSEVSSDGSAYSAQSDTVVVGRSVLYRVRGLNSFGEEGPPSETLKFTGESEFTANPAITITNVLNNEQVKLTWEFPEVAIADVKGFEVERSSKHDEGYQVISETLIRPGINEFTDNAPLSTNYYRVAAVSLKGERAMSFPNLVQLEDSIPPSPPVGLYGEVDSTGVVRIRWNNNTESDLLGYRVYRSSFRNAEFNQVTVSPVEEAVFIDTVNINTLTSKMYYKLVAIDSRFNPSDFSQTLLLRLPDVLPPMPPVIKNIRSHQGGVELQWINSSSADVASHHILRKHQSADTWETIARVMIHDTTSHYFDKAEAHQRYQYGIVAVDSMGLKSIMTKPLWGAALPGNKSKIENVKGLANRDEKHIRLSWSYNQPDVSKFLVYRANDDSTLSLYGNVAASGSGFIDRNITMGTEYIYRVKAVFQDGTESVFSDEIKIRY